jgi:predicted O-linked N-acetylglucosamine transferase (SPINDLY family)
MLPKLRDLFRRNTSSSAIEAPQPIRTDTRGDELFARAQNFQQHGQLEEAIELYGAVIERSPDRMESYYKRANALNGLGRLEAALLDYDRAIALDPCYAHAFCNRGAVLERLGRCVESLASYDHAIALEPQDPLAHYNRGSVLKEMRRFDEALASYQTALYLNNEYVEAHVNRGNVLEELGRHEDAARSFDRAIQLGPIYAEAFLGRGVSLHMLKRFHEAAADYDKAIKLKPDYAGAYLNRGNLMLDQRRYEAAVSNYERVIQLDAANAEALYYLGASLTRLKRLDRAVECFDGAMKLNPDMKYLMGDRVAAKTQACEWRDLQSDIEVMTAAVKAGKPVCNPLTMVALLDSPELQRAAASIWVRERYSANDALGAPARRPRDGKIRVGYFSADFCNHPVARLTAGLFEAHDRSRFEITAFAFGVKIADSMRSRLERTFDRFIDVSDRPDVEVAALSRQLGIDIAVDLGGHTDQQRSGIFALRAAPLQISYIGYLGTLAAPYMDYLVADRTVIPSSEIQHYTEQIIYLPSYQVNDPQRAIADRAFSREELDLPATGFVFACLNAIHKLLPETFEMWMRILGRVSDAVLLLYADNSAAERNLRREAQGLGIAPQRLVFAKLLPVDEYMARFRALGLFLDTMPYNAGTTASDALWAGLPVLTCPGRCLASRYAASLLQAVGLPELITANAKEYEDTAVRLALNPSELKGIREKLAANRATAPLFDAVLFARGLESAYAKIYERYHGDLPPVHILQESHHPFDLCSPAGCD